MNGEEEKFGAVGLLQLDPAFSALGVAREGDS